MSYGPFVRRLTVLVDDEVLLDAKNGGQRCSRCTIRGLLLCPICVVSVDIVDGVLGSGSIELIDVWVRDSIGGTLSSPIEAITTCTERSHRLLLQIFADSGEVDHGLNTERIQLCGVSDTGQLKECWSHDRASGKDDFLPGVDGVSLAGIICLLENDAGSRLLSPTSRPVNLDHLVVNKSEPVRAHVGNRGEIGGSRGRAIVIIVPVQILDGFGIQKD